MRLIRCDPGADGIVRMKEDDCAVFAVNRIFCPRMYGGFLYFYERECHHGA